MHLLSSGGGCAHGDTARGRLGRTRCPEESYSTASVQLLHSAIITVPPLQCCHYSVIMAWHDLTPWPGISLRHARRAWRARLAGGCRLQDVRPPEA